MKNGKRKCINPPSAGNYRLDLVPVCIGWLGLETQVTRSNSVYCLSDQCLNAWKLHDWDLFSLFLCVGKEKWNKAPEAEDRRPEQILCSEAC